METNKKFLYYPNGRVEMMISHPADKKTVSIGCYNYKNYKDWKQDLICNYPFNFDVHLMPHHREKNNPLVGVWRLKNQE